MPNPTLIHPESSKLKHFLAIADFYIRCNRPEVYEVEPDIDEAYRPDVYTVVQDRHVLVEVQRSHISNKKMQDKVNGFVDTHMRGRHRAKELWIVSNERFNVQAPDGYELKFMPLKEKL